MRSSIFIVSSFAIFGLGLVQSANAGLVNLIANTNGSANGGLFYRADFQSAGTGVIDPFVRIQHDNGPSNNNHSGNGIEQGYNTSGRPVQYDEHTDPNYTRNLTFGEVPIVNIGGVDYLQFILDINEPNGNTQPWVSLDQVRIYTSGIGSQTGLENTLGTLRYDLDTIGDDSTVTLDYDLNSGSGQGDMTMYIPLANFGGVGANDFIYLYSSFGGYGDDYRTGDGFEEWSVLSPVPAPGALGLLAAAGLLGSRRRRD